MPNKSRLELLLIVVTNASRQNFPGDPPLSYRNPPGQNLNYGVENVIKQLVHMSAFVNGDMKHAGSLESTKDA